MTVYFDAGFFGGLLIVKNTLAHETCQNSAFSRFFASIQYVSKNVKVRHMHVFVHGVTPGKLKNLPTFLLRRT